MEQSTNGKYVVTYNANEVEFNAEKPTSGTYTGNTGIYDDGKGTVTVTYAGAVVLTGKIALTFDPLSEAAETAAFTVKAVENDGNIGTAEEPISTEDKTVAFGEDAGSDTFPVSLTKAELTDKSNTVGKELYTSYTISAPTEGQDCTEYTVSASGLRYHYDGENWAYWMGVALTGEDEFTYKQAGTREGLSEADETKSIESAASVYVAMDGEKTAEQELWLEVTSGGESKTYHIKFKADKAPVTVTVVAPYSEIDEGVENETVRTFEAYPAKGSSGGAVAITKTSGSYTPVTINWSDGDPYTLREGFVTKDAQKLFREATLSVDWTLNAYVYKATVDVTLNIDVVKGSSVTVEPNTPGVSGNKTVTYWFRPSTSNKKAELPKDPTKVEAAVGTSENNGVEWTAVKWSAPEGEHFITPAIK